MTFCLLFGAPQSSRRLHAAQSQRRGSTWWVAFVLTTEPSIMGADKKKLVCEHVAAPLEVTQSHM